MRLPFENYISDSLSCLHFIAHMSKNRWHVALTKNPATLNGTKEHLNAAAFYSQSCYQLAVASLLESPVPPGTR